MPLRNKVLRKLVVQTNPPPPLPPHPPPPRPPHCNATHRAVTTKQSLWQLCDIFWQLLDGFPATGQSKCRLLWEAELIIVGKPTWSLSTRPFTVLASWLPSWSGNYQKVVNWDVKKLSQTNQKLCPIASGNSSTRAAPQKRSRASPNFGCK